MTPRLSHRWIQSGIITTAPMAPVVVGKLSHDY